MGIAPFHTKNTPRALGGIYRSEQFSSSLSSDACRRIGDKRNLFEGNKVVEGRRFRPCGPDAQSLTHYLGATSGGHSPKDYIANLIRRFAQSSLRQIDPVRRKRLVCSLAHLLQRCLSDHTVISPAGHLDTSHQLWLGIVDRAAGLARNESGERRHVCFQLLQPRFQQRSSFCDQWGLALPGAQIIIPEP